VGLELVVVSAGCFSVDSSSSLLAGSATLVVEKTKKQSGLDVVDLAISFVAVRYQMDAH